MNKKGQAIIVLLGFAVFLMSMILFLLNSYVFYKEAQIDPTVFVCSSDGALVPVLATAPTSEAYCESSCQQLRKNLRGKPYCKIEVIPTTTIKVTKALCSCEQTLWARLSDPNL